jgi:hypothetical protein|uniref:Uncharacterized protein n=1 Tax=Siphoviridae sp. ctQ0C17 TaxID=2826325 RepID=A0A8S5NC46_9CAUD|nr:hypothetical protein [uncultured Lachnoclostridium sp.]DAD92270.1 MAG TPA: hypothetical protein [Siphoviridae sp. ctQ0C17]
MKLLLDSRKLILAMDDVIDFVTHESYEKWKVGMFSYYMDNNYTLEEVDEVPIDIVANKYFFIDGEFVVNPNWRNTPEDISKIQEDNAKLKSELSLLQEVVNEMLLGV